MTYQDTKEFITGTIREELASKGVEVKRMILFGSQARQNAATDSDWDFLVCIGNELNFSEKAKLITAIQRKLAEQHISADIIIKSEAAAQRERGNVGVITYYALKDGVPV